MIAKYFYNDSFPGSGMLKFLLLLLPLLGQALSEGKNLFCGATKIMFMVKFHLLGYLKKKKKKKKKKVKGRLFLN